MASVNLDEWKAVIGYWVSTGHDIKHLNIPPDVADALGIELPPVEEINDMTTEETATTEPIDTSLFEWKRKAYFDGSKCGLKGCTKVADGYISGTKPTKGGGNGRLWYGPACTTCVKKKHDGMKPTTLAELAHQRNGASDLALVLDTEVGDILKRCEAAGIDEHGVSLQATLPNTEAPGGYGADFPPETETTTTAPAATAQAPSATTALAQSSAAIEAMPAIAVPTDKIVAASQDVQGVLVFLGTFHVMNQADMDAAGGWLQGVKAQWKELDELRKALGRPYREKADEIQRHFKETLDALFKAEGILKQKIDEGNQRAQQAQQAALAAAQQAHAAGDMAAVAAASQTVVATDVALPPNISQRPLVRFEVIDPSQLPGEFWSPDPNKIQAALTAGHRQIPGVRIWEENSMSSRAS